MKVWIELCFDWVLKYDETKIELCDLCLENDQMKCLWFIKEVCVESMNMKVNIIWFEHDSMSMWKTTGPTFPLALCCVRPLGLRSLWHCVVWDN
jgi:hypothetical protein